MPVKGLEVVVSKATFAQPRSYYLTAQLVRRDQITKYGRERDEKDQILFVSQTAPSEASKTPSFKEDPLHLYLPTDGELKQVLLSQTVVIETYVVSTEEDSEDKYMGECCLNITEEQCGKIMEGDTVECVLTVEGLIRVGSATTAAKAPVGQGYCSFKLVNLETPSVSPVSEQASHQDKPMVANLSDLCPALKYAQSVVFRIRKWRSPDVHAWPESYLRVSHDLFAEDATEPKQSQNQEIDFDCFIQMHRQLPSHIDDHQSMYASDFSFELISESERNVLAKINLPTGNLCLHNQYHLKLQNGDLNAPLKDDNDLDSENDQMDGLDGSDSDNSVVRIELDISLWFVPLRHLRIQDSVIYRLQLLKLDLKQEFASVAKHSVLVDEYSESVRDMNEPLYQTTTLRVDEIADKQGSSLLKSRLDWTSDKLWPDFRIDEWAESEYPMPAMYSFVESSMISADNSGMIFRVFDRNSAVVAGSSSSSESMMSDHRLIGNFPIANPSEPNTIQVYSGFLIDPITDLNRDDKITFSVEIWDEQSEDKQIRRRASHVINESLDTDRANDSQRSAKKQSVLLDAVSTDRSDRDLESETELNEQRKREAEKQARQKQLNQEWLELRNNISALQRNDRELSDSLCSLGSEICRLRSSNESLRLMNEKNIHHLKENVENDSRLFQMCLDNEKCAEVEITEMKELMLRVMRAHKEERRKRKELETKVMPKLQQKVAMVESMKQEISSVMVASEQQKKFIREKRKEMVEVSELKKVVSTHEKLIRQLQSSLASVVNESSETSAALMNDNRGDNTNNNHHHKFDENMEVIRQLLRL